MSSVCNPLKGVTEAWFTAGVFTKAVTTRISSSLRRQEAHAAILQQPRFPLHYLTASIYKFIET